jgi:uncharacterized protein
MTRLPALVIFAKIPVPGQSKTRFVPPCTPVEAAILAEALLADTLDLARQLISSARLVLALEAHGVDMEPPAGFVIVAQRGLSLGERLENAIHDATPPAVLIGMDTPQVPAHEILSALRRVSTNAASSVVGPTVDGGFWCAGVSEPRDGLFHDVPMDSPSCSARVAERFDALGLRPLLLQSTYRDIDRVADAIAVAPKIPNSRFARTFASLLNGAGAARFARDRVSVDAINL